MMLGFETEMLGFETKMLENTQSFLVFQTTQEAPINWRTSTLPNEEPGAPIMSKMRSSREVGLETHPKASLI